ncbi:hypothetical protein I6H88_04185 [Elizabethkingia bruuniana]|uniref:Uncharacterized protein n=1 Tax=Elizabethkingia bruuniana TaxID=1756149 RepID=A0A7T7V0V2_9FLAO|nr:hypothetical protein [Elizabethkingia bruuniana]AQX86080.1 hypothetical protein AYC65_14195 [Elizabethkingia bruuniana]KUY27736.1 hypothetical protein ATB97_18790 [Elizabethkingia bruuniana]OPB63542.1 hypothetical protein BAY12_09055 [Elizabethkingia bruuniana]QQN59790.1 hypothetical protein I6H88_04185 [Elizabethkingia bruuniana]
MKKKQNTHTQNFLKKMEERKSVFSPSLDVIGVEMECGIASSPTMVLPGTFNGDTDQVLAD